MGGRDNDFYAVPGGRGASVVDLAINTRLRHLSPLCLVLDEQGRWGPFFFCAGSGGFSARAGWKAGLRGGSLGGGGRGQGCRSRGGSRCDGLFGLIGLGGLDLLPLSTFADELIVVVRGGRGRGGLV